MQRQKKNTSMPEKLRVNLIHMSEQNELVPHKANLLPYGWAEQLTLLLKCEKFQNAAMLAAIGVIDIKLGNASLIHDFQQ